MADIWPRLAAEVVEWCHELAACSENASGTTRTFLSPPMRDVHDRLGRWMTRVGMTVAVDHAGNLRGEYRPASTPRDAPRLFIGSHLDTVPDAGAFDGILGVVLAVALVGALDGAPLPFVIEVVGFSEEEGVRFGVPFIGSRALAGSLDAALLERRDAGGVSVREAIVHFGLDPGLIDTARAAAPTLGYLEFHIEQGPVLDLLAWPLAVVTAIAGQSRLLLTFRGTPGHAGTTPMHARRDALAAAAQWVTAVETDARMREGLVATVGRLECEPGAANVVPGICRVTLDVRHQDDGVRGEAVQRLVAQAQAIADRRQVALEARHTHDQARVAMDDGLVSALDASVRACGLPVHHMMSGAGHDAMIVAAVMPAAMLLLRTPGGISHDPAEAVRAADVADALRVGHHLLHTLAEGVR